MKDFWGYLLVAGKRAFNPSTRVRFSLALPLLLLSNFGLAQKLSDEAKFRLLNAYTPANNLLLSIQQRQRDLCTKDDACKKEVDEFQAAKAKWEEVSTKEIKTAGFPAGTTLIPDAAKMDVTVSLPAKSETKKPEEKK